MLRNEEYQDIIMSNLKIDVSPVLEELIVWENSLDNDPYDDTILHTIETFIDILVDNCQKE